VSRGWLVVLVGAVLTLPASAGAETTRVSVEWDKWGPDVDLHVWDEHGNHATEIDKKGARMRFRPGCAGVGVLRH
jgi:hypothetical protein